ncbi:MAG: hypothetical protein MUF71_03660 [Candidatus Kapabacteria bacterium]|jgi:hypothetical protein|nr:hypothetical protein [Candidatus Kapabacteria bacterium]
MPCCHTFSGVDDALFGAVDTDVELARLLTLEEETMPEVDDEIPFADELKRTAL